MQIKFNFDRKSPGTIVLENKPTFQTENNLNAVVELQLLNFQLSETKKKLLAYKEEIRKILFMTSHQVRQPIANILALTNLLNISADTPPEIKKTVNYIKESVKVLDNYTKNLTDIVIAIAQKK